MQTRELFGFGLVSSLSVVVERFILEHVDSLEEAEILVHLHRNSDKHWTGVNLARELRLDLQSASDRLEKLERAGIIDRIEADTFRYAPGDHGQAIAALAQGYTTHRTAIITLIMSKPNDKVQTF